MHISHFPVGKRSESVSLLLEHELGARNRVFLVRVERLSSHHNVRDASLVAPESDKQPVLIALHLRILVEIHVKCDPRHLRESAEIIRRKSHSVLKRFRDSLSFHLNDTQLVVVRQSHENIPIGDLSCRDIVPDRPCIDKCDVCPGGISISVCDKVAEIAFIVSGKHHSVFFDSEVKVRIGDLVCDHVLEYGSLFSDRIDDLGIHLIPVRDQFCVDPAVLTDRHLSDRLKMRAGLREHDLFPVFVPDHFHRYCAVRVPVDHCIDPRCIPDHIDGSIGT